MLAGSTVAATTVNFKLTSILCSPKTRELFIWDSDKSRISMVKRALKLLHNGLCFAAFNETFS